MKATVIRRLNTRLAANTAVEKLLPIEIGDTVNVKKLISGEMLRGNRIWAVDDKGISQWSGGLKLDFDEVVTGDSHLFNQYNIKKLWNYSTGENVKICIVDSGITEKPSLKNIVEKFDQSLLSDKPLHGTYMAEIIAAFDPDNSVYGIAPNTILVSYKISPSELTPDALFRILDNNRNADIFNFSLNNRNSGFLQHNLPANLQNIFAEFERTNKILVAATGNEGTKELQFKNFPAGLKSFISVAGLTISSENTVDLFSASNLWDDSHILAPAGAYFDSARIEYHNFETGTSVSSAFISGLFSLIISYCKKQGHSDYKEIIKTYLNDLPVKEITAVGGTIKFKQILPNSLINFFSNL